MKKTLIYIILFSFTMVFMACEKELDTYSGDSGLYFDTEGMVLDTVTVHWGLKNADVTKQTISLKVKLFGEVKEYDRPFSIQVEMMEDDSIPAVEGRDYEAFPTQYVMKAGEAETVIDITLLRDAHLVNSPARFGVKLIENSEFKFLYTRYGAQHVNDTTVESRPLDYQRAIYMDEKFSIPSWWSYYGEPLFGTFSSKKAALICEVMGIDRELWMKDIVGGLGYGYLKFCGKYMYRWLQENPQTEDDGTPMEMGEKSVS